MMGIFRRPMIWITVSVMYVWLFSISMFITTIGPPIVIAKIADADNSISLAGIKTSFLTYAQEVSKRLHLSYDYVLYSLIWNIVLFIPALLVGFFVLRKKLWARNAMIALLSILVLFPLILGIITSGVSIKIVNINMFVFLAMIFILTRKDIESTFT